GVTIIGEGAFFRCTALTSVIIGNSVTNIGSSAFYGCSSLTNCTFLGNAPQLIFDMEAGGAWFAWVGAGARAYYYCGTTGWGANYGGLPTVTLFAPRIAPGSAGVKPGGFGFTLTCLTNQSIVVEASANLANWQPIWTNTLPGASADFVDPEWLHHPNRFYRAHSD
ncbi:MAG TPA: leucine-rich repeat domain-containing protein, partial [Verrucomicrobiae bacterium]|nr:leucine-rich repeat domain-containing protein [Verrucomicrobiae bacterium]